MKLGYEAEVWRNDKFELADVEKYDKILLSPGPGIPEEAGLLLDVIKTYAATKSIFGVCLGQQAIAEVFGGTLLNLGQTYAWGCNTSYRS
jgi:anthranilate synthase component 2